MAKLLYKLHISGNLIVESGLHIGGSEVDLDIGGIDKEVVKVKTDKGKVPYIPGSSLKGKLRSLIARQKGYVDLKDDRNETKSLFAGNEALFENNRGERYSDRRKKHPKDRIAKTGVPTRLIVRDTYLIDEASFKKEDNLEDKAENTINRVTGEANPRHLERVTRGTAFELDLMLDVYQGDNAQKLLETLDIGFQMLSKDYLGGGGTRGSGKVTISNLKASKIEFKNDGSIDVQETYSDYEFKTKAAV